MVREYITSKNYLPDDPGEEVHLQLTDAETKEIFETRARLAREPDELSDPVKLVVRGGPHEDTHELWYAQLIETDEDSVDQELLRECLESVEGGSEVINARSRDLKALLTYLVETGEFENHSEATRKLLWQQLAEEYTPAVRLFDTVREQTEESELDRALRSQQ